MGYIPAFFANAVQWVQYALLQAVCGKSLNFAANFFTDKLDMEINLDHSLKNRGFRRAATSIAVALISLPAFSQGTVADYNRAYSLRAKFSGDSVLHWAQSTAWKDSSHVVHYQISTPEGRKYIAYDIDANETRTFSVREEFEKAMNIKPRPAYRPQPGRQHQRHWMEVDEEKEFVAVTSPDGKKEAYVEGCNVVVHEVGKPYTEKRILTMDGTIANYYSNRIVWSPDASHIFVCKRRPVEKRYVYYVESSPADQLQPILHKQEYAKPGDELPQFQPVVIDVATGKRVEADINQLANQYSLEWQQWTADGKEVTMEYNQRGHHVYRLVAMDANSGKLRTIVEERSEKFVNYPRIWRQFVGNGKQLLWTSERDNWNHIYLYDVEKACLVRQITKGEWCVREIQYVDEEKGEIFFSACGMNAKEDPYLIHYYKIGMDGKNLVALTPEEGNHHAVYSYDRRYLVDTYSKVDQAPVTVIRSAENGKLLKTLEKADISKLQASGWQAPEVFKAKARDGKTDIWGIIQRPTNFDATKRYPVIEYIYAGPGDAYTPKDFMPFNWNMTALAELGFVVVQLDGMGTAWRGKKFEEICCKNLKDAGFPDRKLWIKAAAKRYPYLDAGNVGIFGASAGGQESTTAVLLHGDFYKAAYSSCGCHDNRMDKIWWNELWLGYPVDSSYVECSNVENAQKLERPLMLVVGEMDDNVDPASTMQVANALIKANKNFELVVLPGVHHTMGESFGEHKRFDFFVKNLLGVEPPKWSEIKTQ